MLRSGSTALRAERVYGLMDSESQIRREIGQFSTRTGAKIGVVSPQRV